MADFDPGNSGEGFVQLPEITPGSELGLDRYESLSPLDTRYRDPEVLHYMSEEARIAYQAGVEAALADTCADFGICTREQADEIINACSQVRAMEVYEEEGRTRHDIKALTNVISGRISDEAKPFVHFTATSYDIISTAEALRYRDFTRELLIPRATGLQETLLDLADRYSNTPQIGRTHGQHGSPSTFGFTMAAFADRLGISIGHLAERADELKGKFSGAVGGFNASSLVIESPDEFEALVLSKLGLEAPRISTQIIPSDQFARLFNEYGVTGAVVANIANDMRHLQRSEINEIREQFDAKEQTGSSAMPHKRNPISFENVYGLNRTLQALVRIPADNIISEHHRDLADSASGRFYTEIAGTVAEMVKRLDGTMRKLEVDEEALNRNLHLQGGAIGGEALQTLLRKYGHPQAHDVVREIAQSGFEQGKTFREALSEARESDPELREFFERLTQEEKDIVLGPERHYTGIAAAKARQVIEYWRSSTESADVL